MSQTTLLEIPTSIPKERLGDALQQALGLEIATIPTYLYSYYSIKRSWNQVPYPDADCTISASDSEVIDKKLRPVKLSSAEGVRQYIKKHNVIGLTDEEVQEMTITIQVHANKAAAYIMSVVIEEMLHTGLISNIKQALIGPPDMLDEIPSFPTCLPGHVPEFVIDQARYSQEQLITFLKIESPEAFEQRSRDAAPIEYKTIGDFYKMIENCIADNYSDTALYNSERIQLIPRKGIYTSNSINTVHYDRDHNPHFPSEDDSGGLLKITNLQSALKAMEIIVEQGEGHSGGSVLNKFGEPDCKKSSGTSEEDKDATGEYSHFAKFLQLYCEGKELIEKFETAFKGVFDDNESAFHNFFVYDVPDNPRLNDPTDEYYDYSNTDIVEKVATLTQQIYTYTFLMLETCYYHGGRTQYEIFMFGMHKSMIWIISELCNKMKKWDYTNKDKETFNVGAVFQKYNFAASNDPNILKNPKSPKEQMIELCDEIKKLSVKYCKDTGKEKDRYINCKFGKPSDYDWYKTRIQNLPDIQLDHSIDTQNLLKSVASAKH